MKSLLSSQLVIKNPPSDLLNQAMLDNTYDNPLYLEAVERKRRNREQLDKLIKDYRFDSKQNNLYLPRGYQNKLNLDVDFDKRVLNPAVIPKPSFELREYQFRTLKSTDDFDSGVIVAPTGAGKTIMSLELIYRKQQKTLILVHTEVLMKQWMKVIEVQFGIKPGRVDGKRKPRTDSPIVVGMMQSGFSNLAKFNPNEYGLILADECHHVPAETFREVIDNLPAHFRYGVSATINRKDGLQSMLFSRMGGVIARISRKEVEDNNGILPAKIAVIRTGFNPFPDKDEDEAVNWNDYLVAIQNSDARNQLIAKLAVQASERMPTIVLVDRIEHAREIHKYSGGVFLVGKMKGSAKDAALRAAEVEPLTIGTTSLLGEGVDISRWQALVMGSPVSDASRLLQLIGRVIRPNGDDKKFGYIADLIDDHGFSGGSFKKRFKVYREEEYQVNFRDAQLPEMSVEEIAHVHNDYFNKWGNDYASVEPDSPTIEEPEIIVELPEAEEIEPEVSIEAETVTTEAQPLAEEVAEEVVIEEAVEAEAIEPPVKAAEPVEVLAEERPSAQVIPIRRKKKGVNTDPANPPYQPELELDHPEDDEDMAMGMR